MIPPPLEPVKADPIGDYPRQLIMPGSMTTKHTPMEEGQPSRTALRSTLLRAAHRILDDPKILDGPVALRIIGTEGAAWIRSNVERLQESRFLRAFVVARSRYAEDELAQAVEKGVRQYVILGAGLETFPHRNPYPGSAPTS
jgi:O-methyltransferase involved in polyketide biosynthesis